MIALKTPLDLVTKLLELLVKLLETLVKIIETFRKAVEKNLTAQTINQLSSFVIYAIVILASQAVVIVLLNLAGK